MTPGPPDFSTTVTYGETAFGFVAYRHDVYLQAGKEGYWLHVPSWLFGVGVLGLALLEWAVLKYVVLGGWRALRHRWAGK